MQPLPAGVFALALCLAGSAPTPAQEPAQVPARSPSRLPAGAVRLLDGTATELRSEARFGNFELRVAVFVPPAADGQARVLLGDDLELARPRASGEWQTLEVCYRHEVERPRLVRAWLDGRATLEKVVAAGGEAQALPGLLATWPAAETPDLGDGGFAVVVRFRSRGDGTLVAKAPAAGDWAPRGKTLFLRGGRLVYDIGWVGALSADRRYDDGAWHVVVLTHTGRTAQMFVDGRLAGERADFTAPDAAGHVLEIGATSRNFGGGLLRGEIAEVSVFTPPLSSAAALAASRGEQPAPAPRLRWQPATDAPEIGDDGVVRSHIRLRVEGAGVLLADACVRPLADVDHRALIAGLDAEAFARGEKLFASVCAACHGVDGETTTLPTARPFSRARLENGADPLSLFGTLTRGFKQMPPQTWMTPAQRYDVIHYLRERFLAGRNPSQYVPVGADYLAALPRPLPTYGDAGAGKANQPRRDFGVALASQLGPQVPAALSVPVGEGLVLGYDQHRLALVGTYRGFIDLSGTQHYEQRGESIARPPGPPLAGLSTFEWDLDGSFAVPADKPPRGPVPAPALHYRGHFAHGREAILDYTIFGRGVLERPRALAVGERVAIAHTLRVDAGTVPLRLAVARAAVGRPWPLRPEGPFVLPGDPPTAVAGRVVVVGAAVEGALAMACVRGDTEGLAWHVDGAGRAVLGVPAGKAPRVFEVVCAAGSGEADLQGFAAFAARRSEQPPDDLSTCVHGGPRRWPEVLHTRGRLGRDDGSYTVDTLTLPDTTAVGAWLRTSALDVFDDGRIAVCTLGGDVWLVSGVDAGLTDLRWQRFAAGLFEPLGLAIVDGRVHVTCRDGIVRLHDLDGDGEADRYERVYSDTDVTASFHAFNFDLQAGSEGRLFYVKSGRYTQFALPGAVVEVAPDGTGRYVATGFRTPNGMGTLPDGSILVSDNQGNWVPASKISRIREGGFYGVFQTDRQERDDFERPLLWLPQEVDSSSGGQLWLGDPRSGPLAGHLLHTSFGKGWAYVCTLQEVGDVTQASCVILPFQFDAGIQRARQSPADGQVYVVGLSGWQGPPDGKDGCLQRLRWTGRAATMLLGAEVTADGVELEFSRPLAEGASDAGCYRAACWNYRWAPSYGSAHWSVREPAREGEDSLPVRTASVTAEGARVRLQLEGLQPVDQLRITCDVPARDGTDVHGEVWLTVHVLPGR